MIKGYKSQLMDMYEKIRQKEKSNLANRQKELKEKLPQVFEYEREIRCNQNSHRITECWQGTFEF